MTPKKISSVKSVCPYCGVGCGIVMEVADNRVVKVDGDKQHPTNFGRLCTKGNTCAQVLTDPGRLDAAYLREQRGLDALRIDTDAAISETARRLRATLEQHGADALSFYVSGQMSLEAQYLANKLCKGFIRTNNIESNSRLCMASAGSGYKLSLGADAPPGSYEDFEKANLFFVIGANMADCHPILFLRMMDRVKAGAKLIVVDPRRTTTADKADLYLPIKPGTDLALLNGLLHELKQNGHTDPQFIASFTEGWEEMTDFLSDYSPENVASITGLTADAIRQAAQMIGQASEWMSCWTMGLNQSTHGTWNTNALCNLHLATGAICRPGSGPFSLTGQPNAMGGREMGYMGPGLPGQRSVLVEDDRRFVENLWNIPAGSLRQEASGGTISLFEDMIEGKIKACWIICTNPVASIPNRQKVLAGLQAAELVITQDAFLDTETNRYADIILPGALWAEAEGVMVNSERNLTLMQKAVEPPGGALPDWQIIARVACEMGFAEAFSYHSAAEVLEEIKLAWNPKTGYDIRGVSYSRLRDGPLQWPCAVDSTSDRNPIRYLNKGADSDASQALKKHDSGQLPRLVFATDNGKAVFFARPHADPAELPDADFPFALTTGRLQHQWHTMTKTGKVPILNKLNGQPFIEIHPEDAAQLGIQNQQNIEIRSRRGKAILPALISDRIRPGSCFAPFHWNDMFGENLAINALTSDAVDPISLQPECKFCAVRLLPLELSQPHHLIASDRDEQSRLASEAPPKDAVWILWASQTGTAEGVAHSCAEDLKAAGHAVYLAGMNQIDANRLAQAQTVLFIASTFGDGDPPDNASDFWRSLQEKSLPSFNATRFAVLALGNSNYDAFCGFGRKLDTRMESLGAQRAIQRVECEPDYEQRSTAWLSAVKATLAGTPSCELFLPAEDDLSAISTSSSWTRKHPFSSQLKLNRLLSKAGSEKETRQYIFDLADSGLDYAAGDALGVWPRHSPAQVEELATSLGLDLEGTVNLKDKGDMAVREALTCELEITLINSELLQLIVEQLQCLELNTLFYNSDKTALKQWLWGRQPSDLFREFNVKISAQELVTVLKRMQARLYSIASSPLAHPNEIHTTTSTVRYQWQGKLRSGVCSGYLANCAVGDSMPIFVQKSALFRPPKDPAADMIMVGPGTGIAPFRGFLHERQAAGAQGKNWLFFGEQKASTDFYYRDELEAMQKHGVLHRLDTAFSRDQSQKIYVQNRMLEQGAALWKWLQDGAHFYVCGDASRMAKDVDQALKKVIQIHGNMSGEHAAAYVAAMVKEKRYLRDVY